MKISEKAKHAIWIGSLCSVSYLAVYIARNVLGAVTPSMVEGGLTEEYIGQVSALFFGFYAVGQLINGCIGDRVKAKYMISLGLLLAGISNIVFSLVIDNPTAAPLAYGMTGFFLAMIYGPMTKVVAENTEPIHATRCSLGYTFASFFGSPVAGILASFMAWQSVFAVSSAALCVMAVVCFFCFVMLERRGVVKYGQYRLKTRDDTGKDASFGERLHVLIKRDIIRFSLISILTGIVRTSVVFWLTTYISQYLGFGAKRAAGMFTVATFAISFTTFIVVFIYERLGYNMNRTILLMFSCSLLFFIAVYFVSHPIVNLVLIVLAIMASNGAATMLWSRYCPSLRDTGMVSGATGFLDFLSYMAAATANVLFANAVSSIGWKNLILVWTALVACGVIVSLPYRRPLHRGKKDGAQ